MIVGTGIDLVKVSRIRNVITEWGHDFVYRFFTRGEINYCINRTSPHIHFARLFALKEATLKALGIGFYFGIHLKEIVITFDTFDMPLVTISAKLQMLAGQGEISHTFASITHEGGYAIAQIILTAGNNSGET